MSDIDTTFGLSGEDQNPLHNIRNSPGNYLSGQEGPAAIKVVRWLFYGFIISLPFETVGTGILEPPTVMGGLLLASTLLQPGLFLRWPSRGFWCFIIYLYLFATLGVLEPSKYRGQLLLEVFLLAQLTVLSWIGLNLMRDGRVAKRALLSLGVGCTILAALQVTGVAGSEVDGEGTIARVTAFGFHPNNLARILALGLIVAVGLSYRHGKFTGFAVLTVSPIIVLLGFALIQTGSRGGLLALGAGIMTFALNGRSLRSRLLNAGALLAVIGFLAFAALQSDVMGSRFEDTVEDGDLARRELIYPTSWQMFTEKPLLGWGPVASTYELGMRLGHPEENTKNPHNLGLFALVSTGVVGAIPLFAGILLAIAAAWKARHGEHGALPLAMIVAVLAANMSSLWLFNKLHWLVMAYALASVHGISVSSRFRSVGGIGCRKPLLANKRAYPESVRLTDV